jgi:hypothetical protein
MKPTRSTGVFSKRPGNDLRSQSDIMQNELDNIQRSSIGSLILSLELVFIDEVLASSFPGLDV